MLFSRCHKVLSPAEGAYQEGLPQYYPQSYHLNKLAQARHVFLQNARGPACDKYLVQLDEACERIWKNGRRQCEAISLTGNPCLNEVCSIRLLQFESDFVVSMGLYLWSLSGEGRRLGSK